MRRKVARSAGQADGRSIKLVSRHTPLAPVNKVGGDTRCGGCSENVNWHLFALAIQAGLFGVSGLRV